jgi:hypothetical protein
MKKFMVAVHYEEGILFAVEAKDAEEAKSKVITIVDEEAAVSVFNKELIRQKVVHRDVQVVDVKDI